MGGAYSMLTQYDIEEVEEYCYGLFSQQEIVSLYERFCQLDRNSKGFISADEFLSVPEFAMDPLSQRLLKMVDGLNFKDFVAFLSAFSSKASIRQKIELIFKVYDIDGKGKVTFNDILEVLRDLTGSFMTEEQREQYAAPHPFGQQQIWLEERLSYKEQLALCEIMSHLLEEAGYRRTSSLFLGDFIKILDYPGLKMGVEVTVD